MTHHRLCEDPMCAGDCRALYADEFEIDPSNMLTVDEANDLAARSFAEGKAVGRATERIRIVEWLRARSRQRGIDWKFGDDEDSGLPSTALREAADLLVNNKETL